MPTAGYYCLIQYCPDPVRQEGANVGVVLLCAGRVLTRFARRNDRVSRFFDRGQYDVARVNEMKKALQRRLERGGEVESLESLRTFASLQCNLLRMTPPMGCRVEGEPVATLDRLFDQLVGEESRAEPVRGVRRTLRDAFEKNRLLGDLVHEDVPVRVPAFERVREFPFAWRNGQTNLIEPVRFGTDDARTVEATASRLALEGRGIRESGGGPLGDCRLHVLADFESRAADFRPVVRNLLEPFEVTLVESSELPAYVQRVRAEGHSFTVETVA